MSNTSQGEWWKSLENSDVSEIHVHTEPSGDIYIERNFDNTDEDDDATLDEDPPAPPSPPHYHTQSSPSFVSDRELKRELSVASPRNNVSKPSNTCITEPLTFNDFW